MTSLNDVKLMGLQSFADERGVLTAIEGEKDISFKIKRVFYLHHVNGDRAGHAHRSTDQVIIPVFGSFSLIISDGINERIFEMSDPKKGVYVPRMLFTSMKQFSDGAVCLVLANTHYDISQSIRTWDSFVDEVNNK
jgi:dTDP-4-dehydrorhamnose 3,5-epimerase-like enzyme